MIFCNNEVKDIFIKIIIGVIANKSLSEFDLNIDNTMINKLIKLAKYHSVECIIYYGLKELCLDIPEDFSKYSQILEYKCIVQDAEKESICRELSAKQFKHLPLKGCIIRKLYPKIQYRSMADIDILIKKEMVKSVNIVMKNLGYYLEHGGGNHDVYYKKPYMNVEIHRNMVDESYIISKYYKDIWSKLTPIFENSYEYELSIDDYYIFMIAHASKHFGHGGTGVRILSDLYIYLKEYMDKLNWKYINEELDKIELRKFNKILISLTNHLFSCKDLLDDEKILLEFLIDSGTYGTVNNSAARAIDKNKEDLSKGKNKYLINRIFPSYSQMKRRNPILNKLPFLLPWFWITRLFKGLFSMNRFKGELRSVKNIDNEQIEKINKIKDITGIE